MPKQKPESKRGCWMIDFSRAFAEQVEKCAKQNGRTVGDEIEFRVQRDLDRELIATANTARALKKRGVVLLRQTKGVKMSRLPKKLDNS